MSWLAPSPAAAARVPSDRFRGIERQGADWSCGAAALATLLREHLGYADITEEALLETWRNLPGNAARSLADGLSPNDIAAIVAADPARFTLASMAMMSIDTLARQSKPVIVSIQRADEPFAHFVVVKGIAAGQVHIADPLLGHIIEPVEQFHMEWTNDEGRGLAIAIDRRDHRARSWSALRPPGQPGAVEAAWSLREALLRRDATLTKGAWRASVGMERAAARLPSKSPGIALAHHISTRWLSIDYGLGHDTTISATLLDLNTRFRINRATAARTSAKTLALAVSRLLRPQLDDGTPQIIGGIAVARGLTSGPLIVAPEFRIRSTNDQAAASTSVSAAIHTSLAPGQARRTLLSFGTSARMDRQVTPTLVAGLEMGADSVRGVTGLETEVGFEFSASLIASSKVILSPSFLLTRRAGAWRQSGGVSVQFSF